MDLWQLVQTSASVLISLSIATTSDSVIDVWCREKDANRRVELGKLRDDDRTRRMMCSTSVSQLHEQHMFVAGFEDRLKLRNSPALLGPNILAGAFRNWSR